MKIRNQDLLSGKEKIVFNKNIEKYTDFKTSISNNNTNYFSYVNRDVTVETKIIGSATLKGEDVKLTKQSLININKTVVADSTIQFNSNTGESLFGPTIIYSKNDPIKAGSKLKITIHDDSSVLYLMTNIFLLVQLCSSVKCVRVLRHLLQ